VKEQKITKPNYFSLIPFLVFIQLDLAMFNLKSYGKSSWQSRCFKKQDQWDTNCIFTELAGFHTLETDQYKLTVGSTIIGGQIRSRTQKILEENSNYLIFPKKRGNLFGRCHKIPYFLDSSGQEFNFYLGQVAALKKLNNEF